jgi:protein-disulfide isomerase
MRLHTILSMVLFVLLTVSSSLGLADVDWQIKSNLQLKETPLDMKLSKDGQWVYLLTDAGDLLVYSPQGEFNGKIAVGKGFDQIETGPSEEEVYLLSRKNKRIQVIKVNFAVDIDISGSPYMGPDDAPVTIVEFTDFQCPYCARLVPTLNQIMQLYPNKVKIVYKSFPLYSHAYSRPAAIAATAAGVKGKFWEFHDMLFENYNQLNKDKVMEIRTKFGLDTPDFDALMNSTRIRSQVAADRAEGIRIGVHSTPSVFINGKRLKNRSLAGFQEAIDKELKAK